MNIKYIKAVWDYTKAMERKVWRLYVPLTLIVMCVTDIFSTDSIFEIVDQVFIIFLLIASFVDNMLLDKQREQLRILQGIINNWSGKDE